MTSLPGDLGNSTAPAPQRWRALLAPAVFLALTLAMFGDVLVGSGRVLSHQATDLALQFLPWRHFGFEQLRAGNLPLWNPHIYGGTPYFAGFQSALLYPPNWLHLFLPLTVAINWIIALHVFAAGYLTYLWCRNRQISVSGSILAGAMFMFSGPYFLHLYAGHLPHLAVMVWSPLVLLAIDALAARGGAKWVLLGIVALTMQILAGHPQYVYYTAIVAGVYVILHLIRSQHRRMLIGGFVVMYVAAAMLSAVQLLPGIVATKESVRGAGTEYEFASTFALPPRNFITLVAPNFFGRLPMTEDAAPADAHWGAGYLWEMSLFASVTGLILATYGAVATARSSQTRIALAMVGITLLLALGRHTPLYRLMYDYIPEYASFRGTVKFAYVTILFLALLAGWGFDDLIRRKRIHWGLPVTIAVACLFALLGALLIARSGAAGGDGAWAQSLQRFARTYGEAREIFVKNRPEDYAQPEFVVASSRAAARSLYIASAAGGVVALLLVAMRFRPVLGYGLIVLAVVELFIFARATRATMIPVPGFPKVADSQVARVYETWQQALRDMPRDQRVLILLPQFSNHGMSMGFDSLWGYDPLVLRRYAELLHASQGQDPDRASQYLGFRQVAPGVFRTLRCGRVLLPDPRQPVLGIPDPLPVVALVGRWIELPTRDSIFSYMLRDEFDPRRGVVLEEAPGIPAGEAVVEGSNLEIITAGTDHLDVRVNLPRAALLLITNNYSRGWRARSLDSQSVQTTYTILPANYTQQAIPLEAGRHHLRIEYSPIEFRIGAAVSAIALVGVLASSLTLRRFSPWHGTDRGS